MKTFLSSLGDVRTKHALFYSIVDGVLWALMYGFAENYMVPFAKYFRATAFQASVMMGAMQAGVSLGQLLGATIIARLRKRRRLSVIGNIVHALSYIIVPPVAILTNNPWLIIVIYALGAFASNIGGPGWISWMNDIVPVDVRGAFWGIRNRILTLAQFSAIIVAGVLLYFAEMRGFLLVMYVVLFTIAGLSRLTSVIPLSKQYEPPMPEPPPGNSNGLGMFIARLTATNFGRFALFSFLLTFAVNVMAPVVPFYLLRGLGFNILEFTIVMMSSMVSTFLAMSYWGKLADRYGNYRILLITAVSLPLIAFGWAFVRNFYLLILWQLFSGFVWSGFNLSNQNYIFDSVRSENMSRMSAYFISVNNFCAFVGSLIGGTLTILTERLSLSFLVKGNYELVFILSGTLRLVIILVLIRRFDEVRKVAPSPTLGHFYIYYPMWNIVNSVLVRIDRIQKMIRTNDDDKDGS